MVRLVTELFAYVFLLAAFIVVVSVLWNERNRW